jgi:hypothetical protein
VQRLGYSRAREDSWRWRAARVDKVARQLLLGVGRKGMSDGGPSGPNYRLLGLRPKLLGRFHDKMKFLNRRWVGLQGRSDRKQIWATKKNKNVSQFPFQEFGN